MGQSIDESREHSEYPRAAPLMVGLTLAMFLGIMMLLGYRWLNMAEPNGFVLVDGSDAFAGAVAAVDGMGGNDLDSTARLTAVNHYQARFPLPEGTYQLTVTWRGIVILKQPIQLREAAGMVYTLDPKLLPATQPAQPE